MAIIVLWHNYNEQRVSSSMAICRYKAKYGKTQARLSCTEKKSMLPNISLKTNMLDQNHTMIFPNHILPNVYNVTLQLKGLYVTRVNTFPFETRNQLSFSSIFLWTHMSWHAHFTPTRVSSHKRLTINAMDFNIRLMSILIKRQILAVPIGTVDNWNLSLLFTVVCFCN